MKQPKQPAKPIAPTHYILRNIPPDMHQELRMMAVVERASIRDLILRGIKMVLEAK